MKRCTTCAELKPLGDFQKSPTAQDGRCNRCNGCRSAARRAVTAKKKEIKRLVDAAVTHKECSNCKEKKPLSEFRKQARGRYGVRGECKTCAAVYQKAWDSENITRRRELRNKWARENPEKVNQMLSDWRQANRLEYRVSNLNRLALKKGDEGKIQVRDVKRQLAIQQGCCFWCFNKCRKNFDIDHRIPFAKAGKNTAGNIVISCPNCNRKKNDKLPIQFKRVLAQKES